MCIPDAHFTVKTLGEGASVLQQESSVRSVGLHARARKVMRVLAVSMSVA